MPEVAPARVLGDRRSSRGRGRRAADRGLGGHRRASLAQPTARGAGRRTGAFHSASSRMPPGPRGNPPSSPRGRRGVVVVAPASTQPSCSSVDLRASAGERLDRPGHERLLDRLGFRPCPGVGKPPARLERPDRALDHAPVAEVEAIRRADRADRLASVNHSATRTGSVSADHVAAGEPVVAAVSVMGSIGSAMAREPR